MGLLENKKPSWKGGPWARYYSINTIANYLTATNYTWQCCDGQTLVNAICRLTVCSILSARIDGSPINPTSLAAKIKAEQKSKSKAYPKIHLTRDCRYLNLVSFLASHEASGINWMTQKTI